MFLRPIARPAVPALGDAWAWDFHSKRYTPTSIANFGTPVAGAKLQPQCLRAPVALAAKEASIPALTSNRETATWDPEGLLSRTPMSGGHFDRRDRKQKM